MFLTGNGDIINFDDLIQKENDTPLFNEFKYRLKEVGIDIILVTSYSRYNSHQVVLVGKEDKFAEYYKSEKKYYKKIPRLSLYVRTIDEFSKLDIDEPTSKPNNIEITLKVSEIWKQVLTNDVMSEYYDVDMSVLFKSFPKHYLISKIYSLRDVIKNRL